MKTQFSMVNKILVVAALTCTFSSTLAFAMAQKKPDAAAQANTPAPPAIQIPQTAQLVATTTGMSGTHRLNGAVVSGDVEVDPSPGEDAEAIQNVLTQWLASPEKDQIESKCQIVYNQWQTPISTYNPQTAETVYDGVPRVRGYDPTSWMTYETIVVNSYCAERDLQQQQILSLKKSCEVQPTEQCFSQTYLDYLGKLQATQYYDINKPAVQ
jgi:hypothetical protein